MLGAASWFWGCMKQMDNQDDWVKVYIYGNSFLIILDEGDLQIFRLKVWEILNFG
jgi:hypothetical protein